LVVGADTNRTDINKVFFLDSDTSLEAIRAEFEGTFDVIPATVPMLGPNSGELSLAGVHKAAGIQVLIEHLGIAHEDTLAYGDGLNDLEMLAYVHTGIAMGNAHPQAKAAADDLTGSPDQHGIHTSFTKYGLI
jgi:hydroxymethylpyrimidine pyrophosphatase-like HAD family hydrolase